MIQLKVRTEYSFGQTFAPLKRVVSYLKDHGTIAAGIVDTNTWGHVAWFKACTEAGIQPLLGAEVVVSDDDERIPRMRFLASDTRSLSELYKAMSLSHRQVVRTKRGSVARLFYGDVASMSEDILKFAGNVTDQKFLRSVSAYADIYPSSDILNKQKRDMGLPFVYISDNFYMAPEDRSVFEVMAKAGTKPTPQHLLLDLPQNETMREIIQRCHGLKLPMAPMIHMDGDLEELCRSGIVKRGMVDLWVHNSQYEKRLTYELDIIQQKNYQSYFIVVADMVAYAKAHMLVGPSRGSAAGSLVCYLAGITEIDPIPPGLFFERFIDITRKDLPDIDLDFPDDKRQMVFDYMAQKYGNKNVAHIGTVSKYAPRSALIQVCKAMDIPPSATHGVKTAMIHRSSADARAMACLEDTLNDTEPGRAFLAEYPHAAICAQIEGHASHTGVHAAGLIICNEDIQNYATVDDHGIAHIEMKSVADLGLLKIDVLGLTTLSVLEQSGIEVDWYKLPLNDPKAYEVFNAGRMCGVFQFEGEAMRSISTQMKIETIDDVDAITALARPGPFAGGVTFKYLQRRRGESPVESIHPLVEPFMRQSYGLPIYQEQTLAICREIGNFGWKEAAAIRRAMSKSLGVEFFNQYWEMFRDGAALHGIKEDTARRTWEMIMTMGSWQMNKAHTYSYAVISYWCAWLKGHYPLEFAASTLRNTMSEESAQDLLREMIREGIEHVPFDPDLSEENWSVKNGKLIGGYIALHGIGPAFAKKYLTLRAKGALTQQHKNDLMLLQNAFTMENLFPINKKYGALYGDDQRWRNKHGIQGEVLKIADILKNEVKAGTYVYLMGSLIRKNPHSINEEPIMKKQGRTAKITTGPLEYLDLRLKDDTGTIGGRIQKERYKVLGLPITEKVDLGAELVVRATFYYDSEGKFIPYAFITNWKRLDIPNSQWMGDLPR